MPFFKAPKKTIEFSTQVSAMSSMHISEPLIEVKPDPIDKRYSKIRIGEARLQILFIQIAV